MTPYLEEGLTFCKIAQGTVAALSHYLLIVGRDDGVADGTLCYSKLSHIPPHTIAIQTTNHPIITLQFLQLLRQLCHHHIVVPTTAQPALSSSHCSSYNCSVSFVIITL